MPKQPSIRRMRSRPCSFIVTLDEDSRTHAPRSPERGAGRVAQPCSACASRHQAGSHCPSAMWGRPIAYDKDIWATAVALALLDVAQHEKRPFALLCFDGA